ncbi:MAG: hypothetical protein IPM35_31650 [Myxococcales bacterium]|nr:hypothetical protein [Myxococcales bacterium]
MLSVLKRSRKSKMRRAPWLQERGGPALKLEELSRTVSHLLEGAARS